MTTLFLLKVCDWAESAGCTLNVGDNTDKGESNEEQINEGNPLCPLDWDIHHLVPHETKCSQFYYCVQGQLVLRNCPSGTHFNAELQVLYLVLYYPALKAKAHILSSFLYVSRLYGA